MRSLFVSVIGQDDNIGDSVLRRAMIDALRRDDIQMHLLVGHASEGYISGLRVRPRDVIYRDRNAWLKSMKVRRGRGRTSFLANAGEIVRLRGPLHLGQDQLYALAAVRSHHGALLQAGAGIRNLESPRKLAQWSALRFFDHVAWRDASSRDFAGVGIVIPDWGFLSDDPLSDERALDPEGTSRDVLAVTLRGDRIAASGEWIDAVRRFADRHCLRIETFVQVARDQEMSERLAHRLDAVEACSWTTEDHAVQEHEVRQVFRRSAAVISDRLHALVIGATEGAYPLGVPTGDPGKLIRTLEPAKFTNFIDSPSALSEREDQLTLPALLEETPRRVHEARVTLSTLASDFVRAVRAR